MSDDPMGQQRDIDEADRMARLTLADALADCEEHGYHRGVRDERARVRKELEAWLIGYLGPQDAGIAAGRRIVDEIERICPKEVA